MAKVIAFTLDAGSIDKAVRELKKYQTDFMEKCKLFREKIAERIAWSAAKGFSTATADTTFMRKTQGGRTPEPPRIGANVDVRVTHDDGYSIVFAEGEEALFIEFGAGVYYNTPVGSSPHPWGEGMGYTIGSYGKGNGRKNVWGFFDGTDVVLTHGTPAAMPMYRGVNEAISAIDEIAREVFG